MMVKARTPKMKGRDRTGWRTVPIPVEAYEELRRRATAEHMSIAHWVRRALNLEDFPAPKQG